MHIVDEYQYIYVKQGLLWTVKQNGYFHGFSLLLEKVDFCQCNFQFLYNLTKNNSIIHNK